MKIKSWMCMDDVCHNSVMICVNNYKMFTIKNESKCEIIKDKNDLKKKVYLILF